MLFLTIQCNPSKPNCPTKDFYLINLAKNRFLSKFNDGLKNDRNATGMTEVPVPCCI